MPGVRGAEGVYVDYTRQRELRARHAGCDPLADADAAPRMTMCLVSRSSGKECAWMAHVRGQGATSSSAGC